MSILLSFLLTAFAAQACPQLDGVYTCKDENQPDEKETYQITMIQTIENGIHVYEIIDEESNEQPFDLRLISDNIKRTQEELLIDDKTGEQIGIMTVTKRAVCSNEHTLNFDFDIIVKALHMKVQTFISGDFITSDANNFALEAVEVTIDNNGQKTTKETRSFCVKN